MGLSRESTLSLSRITVCKETPPYDLCWFRLAAGNRQFFPRYVAGLILKLHRLHVPSYAAGTLCNRVHFNHDLA
jgi:hypothetical protein